MGDLSNKPFGTDEDLQFSMVSVQYCFQYSRGFDR